MTGRGGIGGPDGGPNWGGRGASAGNVVELVEDDATPYCCF